MSTYRYPHQDTIDCQCPDCETYRRREQGSMLGSLPTDAPIPRMEVLA